MHVAPLPAPAPAPKPTIEDVDAQISAILADAGLRLAIESRQVYGSGAPPRLVIVYLPIEPAQAQATKAVTP